MNALPQFSSQASGPRLDNRRIAAGVVDLAVVGLVAVVLRAAAGGEFTAGLAVVTIAWALFYYFVSESTWGQTLGKRLLGLRVERSGGGAADERAIALRTVLRLVDGIAFYLVGLLFMLRSGERRQRLGDSVGGTSIVDAREPSQPTVKSTLKARDISVPEAEEAVEAEPHRAEQPSSFFEPIAEPAEPSEAVAEDESPSVEIVSEPEAQEPVTEDPVAEDPVAEEREVEEPVAEEAPVVEEPVAEEPEVEEPVAEEEPEAEAEDDSLPQVSSPAIEELAGDVASSASKPRRRQRPRPSADELPREDKPADKEISVKPVETVSPMDLVMSESEPEPEKAGKGRGDAA